jgi:hypothetical protein
MSALLCGYGASRTGHGTITHTPSTGWGSFAFYLKLHHGLTLAPVEEPPGGIKRRGRGAFAFIAASHESPAFPTGKSGRQTNDGNLAALARAHDSALATRRTDSDAFFIEPRSTPQVPYLPKAHPS